MVLLVSIVFLMMVLTSAFLRPRRTWAARFLAAASVVLALAGLAAAIWNTLIPQASRLGLTLLVISLAAPMLAIAIDATFCAEVFELLAQRFLRSRRVTPTPERARLASGIVSGVSVLVRACMLILVAIICSLLILIHGTG